MSGKVLKSQEIVNSTSVKKISYTDENNLIVTYLKGTDYLYKNVPEVVFEEMLKAESAGKYLNSNIKGKYEFIQMLPVGVMNK